MEIIKLETDNNVVRKEQKGTLGKAVNAGKWLTFDYAAQKILSVGSFVILARLLVPADFGIIALILLVPNFLNNILQPNFGTVLTHKTESIEKYLKPLWTINIIRALTISLVAFFGAPFIANYLHIERALIAIKLSGIFIIVNNLVNIGLIYLWKDMDLKGIFIRNISQEIAYIAVALPWALVAPSYWALVAGNLAACIACTVSTYFVHPYRPKISFNFRIIADLIPYTKWIYFQNILGEINSNIENIVIGRTISATAVGLYSRAKSVAGMVPGFFNSIMRTVAFPAFAKVQKSSEKIEEGFAKSLSLLCFLYVPIIIVIWAWAEKLILSVLGPQWTPIAGALKILVVASSLSSISSVAFSLFQGIGRPDIETKSSLVGIPLLVFLVLALAPRYGIIGVASAFFISCLPTFVYGLWKINKILGIKFSSMAQPAIIPFLTSCLTILPTFLIKGLLLGLNNLPFFIFMIFTGFMYLVVIILIGVIFKNGPYNVLKTILRHVEIL